MSTWQQNVGNSNATINHTHDNAVGDAHDQPPDVVAAFQWFQAVWLPDHREDVVGGRWSGEVLGCNPCAE